MHGFDGNYETRNKFLRLRWLNRPTRHGTKFYTRDRRAQRHFTRLHLTFLKGLLRNNSTLREINATTHNLDCKYNCVESETSMSIFYYLHSTAVVSKIANQIFDIGQFFSCFFFLGLGFVVFGFMFVFTRIALFRFFFQYSVGLLRVTTALHALLQTCDSCDPKKKLRKMRLSET